MLTTVKRAKGFMGLPLDDSGPDPQLALLLPAASDAIESYCKRKFGQAAYKETVRPSDQPYIMLKQYPIASVTNIMGNEKEVNDYKVWPDKGMLTSKHWPSCELEVDYVAGYILPSDESGTPESNLPKSLEFAVVLLAQHMQRSPGVKSERVGDISVTYADDTDNLPSSVRALISPYRNVNV